MRDTEALGQSWTGHTVGRWAALELALPLVEFESLRVLGGNSLVGIGFGLPEDTSWTVEEIEIAPEDGLEDEALAVGGTEVGPELGA